MENSELEKTLTMQESIIDSLSSGVLAYTLPERKILIFNKEAREIFGIDGKKDVNKYIGQEVMNENLERIAPAIKNLVNPGDTTNYLFEITKNNKRIIIESTTKLLQFQNGQRFILSNLRDITEREQLYDMLYEERRRYRDALTKNSEYSYTFDVNEGYLKEDIIFSDGTKLGETLGLSVPINYDELCEVVRKHHKINIASPDMEKYCTCKGIISAYKKGVTNAVFEHYMGSRDEYIRTLMLFFKDEKTGHIQAFMVANNITKEKKREIETEKIIRRQYEIANSFATIYFATWLIDLEDNSATVLNIPENAWKVTNGKKQYDLKKSCGNFINIFAAKEYANDLRNFLNAKTIPLRLELKSILSHSYKAPNGEWQKLVLIPLKTDFGIDKKRIILAVQNINNEKIREDLARNALQDAYNAATKANTAKTEFLSRMSHDIRTPMNAIIGMTAIAGVHLDDKERIQDCLSKITVASKHLLGLINEVLDMSKIESGRIDLQVEAFALPDLITNLITMSKPQIEKKNHDFSVVVKEIEHENVVGDVHRLEQAFMNLISNAVKYTPDGGKIKLTVTERPTNKLNVGCYEFVIEDNGIGMTPEFQTHIFEPFARAADERVAKIQGTGLGMSITRNIVQMMNGKIEVKSALNNGTKFIVTVYLELQDGTEAADYERLVNLPVLVADDEKDICENTCRILSELGMKGSYALSGKEAVEMAQDHHNKNDDFFAVILDWKMPGMDGLETAKEIRKRVSKDMPIIILSAYDWSEIETEARQAGINSFISKPLFKGSLAQLFHKILGNTGGNEKKDFSLKNFEEISFKNKRALLVEDNEINAEIALEILKMTGLEVDTAENGKIALDKIANSSDNYYDIIFMDIQMPIMNGYEAAQAIRALGREYTKKIPIVAMTANAFSDDVVAAKNAGMNEHIAKPLKFELLLQVLKRWL